MERYIRQQFNQEWKKRKEENRLHNIAIAHCWLAGVFFNKGRPYQSKEEMHNQIRSMRRITRNGR